MKAMSDPALTPTDEDLGHAGLHAAEYRPYVASKYHDAFDAALPVQIEATRRMSD